MKSYERKKEFGEVFTPADLVNDTLDELSIESWTYSDKTWIDPFCGNGNFLIEIKKRLLENGHSIENVLSRIYGVDIMQDNVDECKDRLFSGKKYRHIVNNNIICADALRYHFRFDGSPLYDQEGIFNELFEGEIIVTKIYLRRIRDDYTNKIIRIEKTWLGPTHKPPSSIETKILKTYKSEEEAIKENPEMLISD